MLNLKELVKDKINIVDQKQQIIIQSVGAIKPHKGHTLFEFNVVTKEMRKAKFEEENIHFSDDLKKAIMHKKVIKNKDCIYVSALNKINAYKRLFNDLINQNK